MLRIYVELKRVLKDILPNEQYIMEDTGSQIIILL